jgi:hypothetical protein
LVIEIQSGPHLHFQKIPGMKISDLRTFRPSRTWIVISILVISLILRWILIFRGGQYYISDEMRYEVSRDAVRFLLEGKFGEALEQITLSPEHLGFKVAGIIPALIERMVGTSLVLPAIFFSLLSVLNLYLIFLLSHHLDTSSNEALYAIFVASSCLSLLYYSRHLFPYDMAMSFGLLALYVASARNQTVKTSLACGTLSFLCFITYNGYWPLAGLAMLVNILMNSENISRILQKTIFTAIGFMTMLSLLVMAMLRAGTNMISAYQLYATSITQGSFEEGWSLPLEYFWHTEHTVILIVGILSIIAILSQLSYPRQNTKLWLGGILFIYLCLFIPSVILHTFVVYGRLARQMIPFLSLLSAQGLVQIENRASYGRSVAISILVITYLQAAWNFTFSYNLNYPREFVAEAQAMFPKFEFSSKRLAFGAPVICQNNGYIIENAKYYVIPPEIIPNVEGQLLLSALHPENFLPYQYDGDPPAIRQIFRIEKLRMNFYKADEKFMSEANPAWRSIKNCVVHEK